MSSASPSPSITAKRGRGFFWITSVGRRTSRFAGVGGGTSVREASRIASASARRSSEDGGASSNSVWSRITCQPTGIVTDCACDWQRSIVPGWIIGESGPITAVASSYPYVIVATAGLGQFLREHLRIPCTMRSYHLFCDHDRMNA